MSASRRENTLYIIVKYDVVIIGSGLGGLACGITLGKEGLGVLVLEQGAVAGGCLQSFRREGYTLDTGMHYAGSLGQGGMLTQFFRYWGINDKVRLVPMDTEGFDEILFCDGRRHVHAMGMENFADSLCQAFPSQQNGIRDYCRILCDVGSIVSPEILRNGRISLGGQEYMEKSALDTINGCISDKRLQDVLLGNQLIFGCKPEDRSLYEQGMINHSFIEGACSFAGGTQHWADSMVEQLQAGGGQLRLKARVQKIHLQESRVEYIELEGGERIECERVISDIHPSATLALLENNTVLRKAYFSRMNALKNSDGVFTLYLLLKPQTVKYSGRNYHLHAGNGRYAMVSMQPETDSEYVRVASVMSRVSAEELSPICGDDTNKGRRSAEYEVFKAGKAEELMNMVRAFLPELARATMKTYSSTPLSWRDYTGTPEGSAYGILKTWQNPATNHIPARTRIENLLLTGQNINLHGALGVAMSSLVTCSEILGTEYITKKVGNA